MQAPKPENKNPDLSPPVTAPRAVTPNPNGNLSKLRPAEYSPNRDHKVSGIPRRESAWLDARCSPMHVEMPACLTTATATSLSTGRCGTQIKNAPYGRRSMKCMAFRGRSSAGGSLRSHSPLTSAPASLRSIPQSQVGWFAVAEYRHANGKYTANQTHLRNPARGGSTGSQSSAPDPVQTPLEVEPRG